MLTVSGDSCTNCACRHDTVVFVLIFVGGLASSKDCEVYSLSALRNLWRLSHKRLFLSTSDISGGEGCFAWLIAACLAVLCVSFILGGCLVAFRRCSRRGLAKSSDHRHQHFET